MIRWQVGKAVDIEIFTVISAFIDVDDEWISDENRGWLLQLANYEEEGLGLISHLPQSIETLLWDACVICDRDAIVRDSVRGDKVLRDPVFIVVKGQVLYSDRVEGTIGVNVAILGQCDIF